jgi:quercetin dioxygenase-like cupin family protein
MRRDRTIKLDAVRGDVMRHAVSREELPRFEVGPKGSHARIFHGEQHELPSVSLMLAELHPGEGPPWHRHDYDEVFVISEGQATYTIGEETIVADSGTVVLVPAGIPHRFVNSGQGVLRQTAVHVAPKVVIERLDEPSGAKAS